jgi:hypothetical protein
MILIAGKSACAVFPILRVLSWIPIPDGEATGRVSAPRLPFAPQAACGCSARCDTAGRWAWALGFTPSEPHACRILRLISTIRGLPQRTRLSMPWQCGLRARLCLGNQFAPPGVTAGEAMNPTPTSRTLWGIVLTGGEGTRARLSAAPLRRALSATSTSRQRKAGPPLPAGRKPRSQTQVRHRE